MSSQRDQISAQISARDQISAQKRYLRRYLQISGTAFLGGSSIGSSYIHPFSGHTELSQGCSCLGLAGLSFLVVFLDLHFLDILEVQ